MSRLTIYKENYQGSTSVPNAFIDEYIESANDCEIKVYLYLLRMLSANMDISIYDCVEKFNHTEKDIIHSLRYWEKKGLLSLDFDENNSICAIHMMDLSRASAPMQTAAQANSVSVSAAPAAPAKAEPEVSSAPVAPEKAPLPAKPKYTAAQLKEFKNRADVEELLCVASSYIGRPLTPGEINTLLFIKEELHFSWDLTDHLLLYCIGLGKKDFRYIEKVAMGWAEKGVKTPEEAELLSAKFDKNIYTILNHLGRNSAPTEVEMAYITKWTRDYNFTPEIIIEACDRTVLKTDSNRFEYADAILTKWNNSRVTNFEDIKEMDSKHKTKTSGAKKAPKQNLSGNYDFAALEKKILSN